MISKEEFIEQAKDVMKHYGNMETKKQDYDDIIVRRFVIAFFGGWFFVVVTRFFCDLILWSIIFFAVLLGVLGVGFYLAISSEKHKKMGFLRQNKTLEKILYDWNIKFVFSNTIIKEYKEDLYNDGFVYLVDGSNSFYIQEGCNDFECFTRFYWNSNYDIDKNEAHQKIKSIAESFHVKEENCSIVLKKKQKIFVDVNGFRLSCLLTGMERSKAKTTEQELANLYDNLVALHNLANGIDNADNS